MHQTIKQPHTLRKHSTQTNHQYGLLPILKTHLPKPFMIQMIIECRRIISNEERVQTHF